MIELDAALSALLAGRPVGVLAVATAPQSGLKPGGRRAQNRVQTAKTATARSPEWTQTAPALSGRPRARE